jgi:polyphosphate kinase
MIGRLEWARSSRNIFKRKPGNDDVRAQYDFYEYLKSKLAEN